MHEHERDICDEEGTSWICEAGITDQERYHLNQAAGDLPEHLGAPRSEIACRVSDNDLYRFQLLVSGLQLDRADTLQRKLFDSLLTAGRSIARLRPADIRAEMQHHVEVVEVAKERDRSRKATRAELFESLARTREQRDRLDALPSGAAASGTIDAAQDRLDRDITWAHDRLKDLQ